MGSCKNPEPFQIVFFFSTRYRFFPLIVFPRAGFTPWPKDSHERGKGKGKGRVKEGKGKNRKGRGKGKGKERERKRTGKRKDMKRKRTGIGNEKEQGKKRTEKRKGEGKGRERKKERKRRGKGEERERKGRGKGEERERKGRGKGEERERKGRGKGEERERKREKQIKKGRVSLSHTDHFWCQELLFSLSFCYRSWILCTFLFSGNGCNHQPNVQHRSTLLFCFLLSFFGVKAKNGSWGIMED